MWIDYVADVGDGRHLTYSIAWLLSEKSLSLNGVEMPRGRLLVMGGDQVYPTATRETYQNRFRGPYTGSAAQARARLPGPLCAPRQSRLVRRAVELPQALLPAALDRRPGGCTSAAAILLCSCRTTGGSGRSTFSSKRTSTIHKSAISNSSR